MVKKWDSVKKIKNKKVKEKINAKYMKGGFKNALPWMVLLTLVLISAGVSLVVVEGMTEEEKAEEEKKAKQAM